MLWDSPKHSESKVQGGEPDAESSLLSGEHSVHLSAPWKWHVCCDVSAQLFSLAGIPFSLGRN